MLLLGLLVNIIAAQEITLDYSQAGVRVQFGDYTVPVQVYWRSLNCYECLLQFFDDVPPNTITNYTAVSTNFPIQYFLRYSNTIDQYILENQTFNSVTATLRQHGYYTLDYNQDSLQFTILVDDDGENADVPIYAAMGILVGLVIVWYLWLSIYRFNQHTFKGCWYRILHGDYPAAQSGNQSRSVNQEDGGGIPYGVPADFSDVSEDPARPISRPLLDPSANEKKKKKKDFHYESA